MIIRSKTPLRLGLAGGGTDVSPFCDEFGGCVLNVTINMYSYCTLKPTKNNKVKFISPDREEVLEFDSIKELPIDKGLPLHCGIYNHPCVCTCAGICDHPCVHVWRPEMDEYICL